jgi:hypothetical protein
VRVALFRRHNFFSSRGEVVNMESLDSISERMIKKKMSDYEIENDGREII